MHHPRDESEMPCYCVVLENSRESDQTIGSSATSCDEVVISNMDDGWIGSDSEINPTKSSTDFSYNIRQFYSSIETKDGRRSCHITADRNETENKGVWIDFEHSVLEGGYVSLEDKDVVTFWIRSNRIGSFMEFGFGEKAHNEHTFEFETTVCNLWERIRISISGIPKQLRDKVRYMSFFITDDSALTDVFIDKLCGETALGGVYEEVYFDNNYRIECWSNNAQFTLIMYWLATWNLLKYRTWLETSWGLFRQRVEGGDIMPQPEFYPEFLYIRSISHTCSTIELIPRETGLTAIDTGVGKIDYGEKGGSIPDP
jgi:hypothetical protein